MQYYLPDAQAINKDFIRQILAGEKHLLKKTEVKSIQVPCYDDLTDEMKTMLDEQRKKL